MKAYRSTLIAARDTLHSRGRPLPDILRNLEKDGDGMEAVDPSMKAFIEMERKLKEKSSTPK